MGFELHRPTTLDEAIRIQSETGGEYIASGTVMLVNALHGKALKAHLISLEAIEQLKGIEQMPDGLTIGAATTFGEIEKSPAVRAQARALHDAAWTLGGPQIRNRATLGGNIACASPASDAVPALMALDAVLRLRGKKGEREVELSRFYLDKFQTVMALDEIIVSVKIPSEGRCSRFIKVGKRDALSVSCIGMAVSARREAGGWKDYRVAAGAAAPKVVRCLNAETALNDGGDDGLARAKAALMNDISPIDDRWSTASYRRTVARNLLGALVDALKEEV